MNKEFSHLDSSGNPNMVDVGDKAVTERTATARTKVELGSEIIEALTKVEFNTKKGPVFQTAILAGIMGAKKTSDLIPFCHPRALTKVQLQIEVNLPNEVIIECTAKLKGKTGVEMEALTGASIAALTLYDMCKAFSHNIIIKETRLIEKRGGKSDFTQK
jgi:cyclic pyranopterin phosphate synthase